MTHDAFNALLVKRLEAIEKVLASKAKEYATSADRLHNFKRSAEVMRRTPAQACAAFMTKHVTSVYDMIEASAAGVAFNTSYIDEKIGDAINYLILLEAILKETA